MQKTHIFILSIFFYSFSFCMHTEEMCYENLKKLITYDPCVAYILAEPTLYVPLTVTNKELSSFFTKAIPTKKQQYIYRQKLNIIYDYYQNAIIAINLEGSTKKLDTMKIHNTLWLINPARFTYNNPKISLHLCPLKYLIYNMGFNILSRKHKTQREFQAQEVKRLFTLLKKRGFLPAEIHFNAFSKEVPLILNHYDYNCTTQPKYQGDSSIWKLIEDKKEVCKPPF